jgi:DNA-binding transcriptional regulator YhcF (GntR family)
MYSSKATSPSADPSPAWDGADDGSRRPWTAPVVDEFTIPEAVEQGLITADEGQEFGAQGAGMKDGAAGTGDSQPNGHAAPGMGHNSQSQQPSGKFKKDDADAVVRLGPVIVSFRRIGFAIHDPRIKRHHLRVLYRYMERLNQGTGTAFPGRRKTAEELGVQVEVVENALYELRKWGYITWEKRAEPTLHKGRLLHYTLPVLRWTEEQLTQAIRELRSKLAAEEYTTGLVHNGACTQPDVPKSTRPVVPSNLKRELEEGADAHDRPFNGVETPKKSPAPSPKANVPPAEKPTKLPKNWALPDAWRSWALANFDVTARQVQFEADKFRDYWPAQHGPKASKLDWELTWRNWCRNSWPKAAKLAVPSDPNAEREHQDLDAVYARLRAEEDGQC